MIKSGKKDPGGRLNKRNKRFMMRYIVFGIIALIAAGYQYYTTGELSFDRRGNNNKQSQNQSARGNDPASNTDQSFPRGAAGNARVLADLQDNKLVYTRHARCRMDCRTISEKEIKEVLEDGKINFKKSKPNDSPCPSYAVEGFTDDGQEVRIVFADCDRQTKVITAIDLKNKYQCHCD